jgi:hypothetical protein
VKAIDVWDRVTTEPSKHPRIGSSAEEGAIGTSNDAATNAPQAAQRANFFEPASNLVNILNILILQFCNVIPVLNEYSKTRVLRKRKTNKTRFFGE